MKASMRETGPAARGVGDVVIDQHNSSTPKTDFTQSWVRPVTANATAVSQASMNASIPGKAAGVKGSLYTDVKRL